jgi:negative regulator of sigma E activity
MATQKEFDDQMREKLQHLEDEPSPRVWAAIQAEVGTAGRKRRLGAWWLLGVAAAVALLATATWLLWPAGEQGQQENNMAHTVPQEVVEQPNKVVAPDSSTPPSNQPAQQPGSTPAPQQQPVRLQQLAPKPLQPGTVAEVKVDGRDSLLPAPIEKTPEFIVQDWDGPIEQTPTPLDDENMAQPLPSYAAMAAPTKVSRGVLGAVTAGAREYLGIDAHYFQEEAGKEKTTTFTADLKFIKITRVRRHRTDS